MIFLLDTIDVTILHIIIVYYIILYYTSSFCFTRIKFPISNKTDKGKKRKADEEVENKDEDKTLIVEPYVTPNRGPYPYNQPKRWEVKPKTQAFPFIT